MSVSPTCTILAAADTCRTTRRRAHRDVMLTLSSRRLCLAAMLVSSTLLPVLAQAPPFPGRIFVGPGHVDIKSNACPELGDDPWGPAELRIGVCQRLGVRYLGAVDNHDWYMGSYRRRWLVSPGDTAAEIEVVLFVGGRITYRREGARTDTLLPARPIPIWHEWYEPELYRSVTPAVARAPRGGTLIAIDECVNGTGGCAQSFALYRGQRTQPLEMQFLDSLNRRFPGRIQHGYKVDVRTLMGEAAVYSDGDGNCCPSRVAAMTLEIRGQALVLAELRIRAAK